MMDKIQGKNISNNGQGSAYCALLFVVCIWGLAPLLYKRLYAYCSPLIAMAIISLLSALSLLALSVKHLKKLDKKYFLVAIPTGVFNSLAALSQKIGLQYTTPTQYAFLENLSCVVVPILMFVFIRQKPSLAKIIASVICLVGAFILSGMDLSNGGVSFGKGEILCALSGVFYGVNIAATGAFAKELFAPLYVMIQMWVQTLLSFLMALSFNVIFVGGVALEKIVFSFEIEPILLIVSIAIVINSLGWAIRTSAMKKIDATTVAMVMPFVAVVTSVASIILKMDTLTWNLCVGGVLIILSSILSGMSDFFKKSVAPNERE